jgi:hypothetical protein
MQGDEGKSLQNRSGIMMRDRKRALSKESSALSDTYTPLKGDITEELYLMPFSWGT